MTHQHTGPPVDETLDQPFVQGVGQSVLDRSGRFLPVRGVFQPVPAVRNESPGPNLADPVGQRIDVANRIVAEPDLLGNPVSVYPSC